MGLAKRNNLIATESQLDLVYTGKYKISVGIKNFIKF